MTKNSKGKITTDHKIIQAWIEERDGQPARLRELRIGINGEKELKVLRIDFGSIDADIEPITWKEFFEVFDEQDLLFFYEDGSGKKGDEKFKFLERRGMPEESDEDYEEIEIADETPEFDEEFI